MISLLGPDDRVFPVQMLFPRKVLHPSHLRIMCHAFGPFDSDVPYFELPFRMTDEQFFTVSIVLFRIWIMFSWRKK